ncbi:MAG: tetratricopeptide repeat protein [Caulobacteraceae bacterium]
MKRTFALLAALFTGACLPPVTAETVELAWEQCDGAGAPEYKLAQCSMVVDFDGTSPQRRAEALIVRGAIRSNQGEYARALADLGRAMRIDRNNAQVYFERGIIHQARGAYDFAIRDFDLALGLQPSLQAALDRRAEALQQRVATFQSQLAQLNERLLEAPTDPGLLNNRCWLRVINDDDLDAAMADCNAAILANPRHEAALDSRGLGHLKRGDYAAALADYEAALAINPDRGHYLYGRGLARLRLGLTAEGNADLAAAEQAEPGVAGLYQTYRVPPIPETPADLAD